ncbi:hypothetical protein M422DRAFT_27033, partial [Sphaerobolus stellatus SS14]
MSSRFSHFFDELLHSRKFLFAIVSLGIGSLVGLSGLENSRGWQILGFVLGLIPSILGVALFIKDTWNNRTRLDAFRRDRTENYPLARLRPQNEAAPDTTTSEDRSLTERAYRNSFYSLDVSKYVARTKLVSLNANSSLWRGTYQRDNENKVVALKYLGNAGQVLGKNERESLQFEIYRWSCLDHRHIARILGFILSTDHPNEIGIISPWYNNSNLLSYLSENPTVNRVKKMAMIASGLKYLHEHEIVHGDVRCANALVKEDGTVVLNDYGQEAIQNTLHPPEISDDATFISTISWSSPERIMSQIWSKESDVYAFASTCLE